MTPIWPSPKPFLVFMAHYKDGWVSVWLQCELPRPYHWWGSKYIPEENNGREPVMSSQPEREWELYETETKLPPRKRTLLCVTSCSLAVFFDHRPTPFVKHHLSLCCITLQAQGNRKPLATSLNGCFHLPLHRFSTSLPMWCHHFLIKLY